MIRLLFFFALSLIAPFAFSQEPVPPCCHCDAVAQSSDVVCLSTDQIIRRVRRIEPLQPTGLDKDLALAGTLVIEVRIDPNGQVECAHAVGGNPIAVSAAMRALPKWTFSPSTNSGISRSSCGRLKIRFRLSSHGSSTKLLLWQE